MPYKVVGKCVHKKKADGSAGEMVKCHESHEKAVAHMRALDANVEDAGKDQEGEKSLKETGQKDFQDNAFRQDEVAYQEISSQLANGTACRTCRFFNVDRKWMRCKIVDDWPLTVTEVGYCNQYLARGEPPKPQPMPVIIVDDDTKAGDKAYSAGIVRGLIESVVGLFRKDVMEIEPLSTPTGFKELPGDRWMAWWTNTYEDKQDETFTEKAIEEYIERVDKGIVPPPELWFWHTGFTRHGKADVLATIGDHAVALGHYDDGPVTKELRAYYKEHPDLEVSHGFYYPRTALVDGKYHAFNTFEISVLPKGKAANPYTSFMEVKEMEFSPEKKALFTELIGEEKLNKLLAAQEGKAQKDDDGVATGYKQGLTPESDKDKKEDQPQPDPQLGQRLKALEDAAGSFATKQDIAALQSGFKDMLDFLKLAFGDVEPASKSNQTEVNPATNPMHGMMADWLVKQGEQGQQQQQRSILNYMFNAPKTGEG